MMLDAAIDPRADYQGAVIAIVGPPHSGKSIFLAELYRQLLQRQPAQVFLHRACPDGEGMWSNEADQAIVQQIRKKAAFSPEFITITLHSIEQLGRNGCHDIVLLDLGGKRTAENAEILHRSTHCIILSAQPEAISAWQTFATAAGCTILATLCSQLTYTTASAHRELDLTARSSLQIHASPIRGTLVNLCRDQGTDCYQAAIQTLADQLIIKGKRMKDERE